MIHFSFTSLTTLKIKLKKLNCQWNMETWNIIQQILKLLFPDTLIPTSKYFQKFYIIYKHLKFTIYTSFISVNIS